MMNFLIILKIFPIFSIIGSVVNLITFNKAKKEIKDGIRKAAIAATIAVVVIIFIIIVGFVVQTVLAVKSNNDIRDENRAGREALQTEMQTLAEANDEDRAEREAWQSEMHGHLVEMGDEIRSGKESLQSEIQVLADANDEDRAEREAWQSEMRKLFLMMYGLMAVCTAAIVCTVIAFGIAHIRKLAHIRNLEHRISELEQEPDDPMLTSGKKIHHLSILSDSDSQAVRRIEGSPSAHQEKA